jgi:dienelactone hydrolase
MSRSSNRLGACLLAVLMAGCRSHCPPPGAPPPRIDPVPIQELEFKTPMGPLRVFRLGAGPPIIVLHEVTGLSPATYRLGRKLAEADFSVYLPLLFGAPGDSRFLANGLRACAGGWFHCFDRIKTNDPRLVEALLAVSRQISAENGRARVGVIGMCLTGNTGLELVREDSPVRAVVASQPALPFFKPSALGVSETTLQRVRDQKVPVLALRFSGDQRSPSERFRRFKKKIGDRFLALEIDSGPTNSYGFKRSAHAVLTTEFVDESNHPTRIALDRVVELFNEKIREDLPSN